MAVLGGGVDDVYPPEHARLHARIAEGCAVRDPFHLEDVDDRFDYGEDRVRIIGCCFGNVLFVVTVSHVEDHYRIISARPATSLESKRYFSRDLR